MHSKLWYNRGVASNSAKKSEQVAMKVAPDLWNELEEISLKEDRPLGYVARELMIRGLSLYRTDGRLREISQGIQRAFDEGLRLAIPAGGVKVAQVPVAGEITDELQSRNVPKKTAARKRGASKAAR